MATTPPRNPGGRTRASSMRANAISASPQAVDEGDGTLAVPVQELRQQRLVRAVGLAIFARMHAGGDIKHVDAGALGALDVGEDAVAYGQHPIRAGLVAEDLAGGLQRRFVDRRMRLSGNQRTAAEQAVVARQ